MKVRDLKAKLEGLDDDTTVCVLGTGTDELFHVDSATVSTTDAGTEYLELELGAEIDDDELDVDSETGDDGDEDEDAE